MISPCGHGHPQLLRCPTLMTLICDLFCCSVKTLSVSLSQFDPSTWCRPELQNYSSTMRVILYFNMLILLRTLFVASSIETSISNEEEDAKFEELEVEKRNDQDTEDEDERKNMQEDNQRIIIFCIFTVGVVAIVLFWLLYVCPVIWCDENNCHTNRHYIDTQLKLGLF